MVIRALGNIAAKNIKVIGDRNVEDVVARTSGVHNNACPSTAWRHELELSGASNGLALLWQLRRRFASRPVDMQRKKRPSPFESV